VVTVTKAGGPGADGQDGALHVGRPGVPERWGGVDGGGLRPQGQLGLQLHAPQGQGAAIQGAPRVGARGQRRRDGHSGGGASRGDRGDSDALGVVRRREAAKRPISLPIYFQDYFIDLVFSTRVVYRSEEQPRRVDYSLGYTVKKYPF